MQGKHKKIKNIIENRSYELEVEAISIFKKKKRSHSEKKRVKSIRKSLLFLFAVLLLVFGGMFLVSRNIIEKKIEDEYRMRTVETAVNNATATIDASLMNYNYLTRLLMINERVVNFLKADRLNRDLIYEARSGIYEIQNLYSYIDSVYIFRNDRNYVGTERTVYAIDIDNPEKERIFEAFGGTVVAINGNGMIKKSTNEPLLTFSRSVYDINSQELIGTLFMNISSKYFEQALEQSNIKDICIMDKAGVVLCGNQKYAEYLDRFDLDKRISFSEVSMDGKNKLMAASSKNDSLVIVCATDDATVEVSTTFAVAMMIPLTAFIICVFILTWYLDMIITRPILKLREAMEKTKSSGWLKKIDQSMPNNEMGILADNYNTMIEYLNELFNQQIENEKNMQKIEMRVLQEQIKPHFLYNTLETISYLAISEDANRTQDALETLGNFYRKFLNKGAREITLKTEVQIVKDYLSLQKLRYSDIFDDEYEIEEAAMEYLIPKLILQPLVENSIYHGIRLKGEKGIIKIKAFTRAKMLHIVVYDTGVGMSEEMMQDVLENRAKPHNEGGSGFGLVGTINRIRYFCNRDDVVKIKSEIGEFTEIEIIMPTEWEEEESTEKSHKEEATDTKVLTTEDKATEDKATEDKATEDRATEG